MSKKEILALIDSSNYLARELREYVDDYVKWVQGSVPEEFYNNFGVGVVTSRDGQIVYGFTAATEEDYSACYLSTSINDYLLGGNFNARVLASSNSDIHNFADEIKFYITEGLKRILASNKAKEKILASKVELNINNNEIN